MDDTISRQAAIDAVYKCHDVFTGDMPVMVVKADAYEALAQLPSAQPQMCDDAISREDAKWVVFCNRDHVEDQANAIDSLPCVQPSAQPEIVKTILEAGYTGQEVRFRIGGRLFAVRELAQ